MRTENDILAKITSAAGRRQANWLNGSDPILTAELTERLNSLWAELRLARGQAQHGDPTLIRRRARIEREIERLMAD